MAKYMIRARIEVDGEVDKSDIIGAIFGFTEGLFGEEFDLRELQDKGRIGRITVDVKAAGGKTVGEIFVPSNLDRIETALLAAALEAVERVGPYNARIQILDIVDVRAEKLKKIIERAKELAKKYFVERAPDLKEILNKVAEEVRIAELTYYGPEKLPAGPDVEHADTIIIVEGRADVLNMLRYGYRNVIALEGAPSGKIPESIIKLASKKTAILFIDGDRAGELIAREVIKQADIDYVARAPPGKEVEELTAKEIAKALKNAVPAAQFLAQIEKRAERVEESPQQTLQIVAQPQQPQAVQAVEATSVQQAVAEVAKPLEQPKVMLTPVTEEAIEIPKHVVDETRQLRGTLEALLYSKDWNAIQRVPVRDLVSTLEKMDSGTVWAVFFDGVITQRLLDVAARKGVKLIVGERVGSITKKPEDVILLTFDDIHSAM